MCKERNILRVLIGLVLGIGCYLLAGCASGAGGDKVAQEIWEKLTAGEMQDLIVVFDDAAILAEAGQLKKAKGILLDDAEIIRFKAEKYLGMKRAAISRLSSGKIEILKDFEVLPIMLLRFHNAEILKMLLSDPLVVQAYKDHPENRIQSDPGP
uniref:Uncharacterized protein n=1 Tax=Candidatus Nitrotoga fabula TaxID=2182327 RepID=A0A2X0QS78_9PROT|nr:protein of unknown function [Candidatus Nitrotoga fabula]